MKVAVEMSVWTRFWAWIDFRGRIRRIGMRASAVATTTPMNEVFGMIPNVVIS